MRRLALTLLLLLSIAGVCTADEVLFSNGDRLTGKVLTLGRGKLTVKTAIAGKVTVAVTKIQSIFTDEPVTLVLPLNQVVRVRLFPGKPGQYATEADGPEYPLSNIKAVNPPEAEWQGSVAVGVTLTTNEINSQDFSISASAKREASKDRYGFNGAYIQGRDAGTTTEESALLNAFYNHRIGARTYGYLEGGLRKDRKQDLDLRTILSGGLGYEFANQPELRFRTQAGISWLNEKYIGVPGRDNAALHLGYVLDARLFDLTRVRHDFAYYPSLGDFGDNYLVAQFSLEQPLLGTMRLTVRYLVDYTSRPGPNGVYSTNKFLLGIGAGF
jgi:putative salt-induced outer membrane protein YdiY